MSETVNVACGRCGWRGRRVERGCEQKHCPRCGGSFVMRVRRSGAVEYGDPSPELAARLKAEKAKRGANRG